MSRWRVVIGFYLMIILVVSVIAVTTDSADAGRFRNGIPTEFNEQGWWNDPNRQPTDEASWQYANYPVPCLNNPTDAAWVVVWLVPEGETIPIPDKARKNVARAGSIFAASAKHTVRTWDDVRHAYSPRWETSGSDNNCGIQFNVVPVPREVFRGPLYHELRTNYGFNQPNRKYLVLMGKETEEFQGYASSDGPEDDEPGVNNATNFSTITIIPPGSWTYGGLTIAHEMTHAMGALSPSMPNYNWPLDRAGYGGHAADCNDIMCYDPGTPGTTYGNGCGSEPELFAPLKKPEARLDCNGDDYFNPGAAWTTQRWAVSSSAFLWGNPSPDYSSEQVRTRPLQTVR